jgi:hypothetical protein
VAKTLAPRSMAPSSCYKTLAPLPTRVFFLFFLLPLRFILSPLRPTTRIDIFDRRDLYLICRSSRARYPLTPPGFFCIDSVYFSRILGRGIGCVSILHGSLQSISAVGSHAKLEHIQYICL